MQRLISIDIAKAICIILVVIGHYHPDSSPEWYHIIIHFIYSFHMPLFMFASGYVYMVTKREEKYKTFITKKIKRLMFPYFSTSIIIISLKLLSQNKMLVENPITPLSYIKIFYRPEAGFFLWFIWTLWTIFLIVPLIKTKQGRTILFIISFVIEFIPFQYPDLFCIKQSATMLKYFMLGVFLYEHQFWLQKAKSISPFIPCIVTSILFVICQIIPIGLYNEILSYVLSFMGIYAVCMISIEISKHHSILMKNLLTVSASSYIIYLFHTTFEGIAKSTIHNIPLLVDKSHAIMFSIGAIVVITCGVLLPIYLYQYVLSKNTLLQLLFGLKSFPKQLK